MHTKGPWVASCDLDDCEEANAIFATIGKRRVAIAYVVDADEIRQSHRGGRVESAGSTAGPDSLDEADDNARLIAAAPELMRIVAAAANGANVEKRAERFLLRFHGHTEER